MLVVTVVILFLFVQAREIALRSKKWLLVNIQADTELACHRMNQETWPDATLRAVIESGYVFWQRGVKSTAAHNFFSLYNLNHVADVKAHLCPALYFIDPRTGALVKSIVVCNILIDG